MGKISLQGMIKMKIPVLSYHSISNDNSNISLDLKSFEKQMSFLRNRGYNSINFDEIKNDQEKKIIITFDDGYKDNLINALPILKKYNFKATCFLITKFIGKNNDWDSSKKDYFKKELLNNNDISEWISNGMRIGSHSHNHKILTNLTLNLIEEDLDISKNFLENKFGFTIDDFCYPFGKVNNSVYQIVKKKFKTAVTTNRSRYNTYNHNVHLIPRIDMGKKIFLIKILLKLETIYEDIKYKKNELYL